MLKSCRRFATNIIRPPREASDGSTASAEGGSNGGAHRRSRRSRKKYLALLGAPFAAVCSVKALAAQDEHDLRGKERRLVDLREVRELYAIAKRCSLMGTESLDYGYIRQWHHEHGFLGGVVVRQLNELAVYADIQQHGAAQRSQQAWPSSGMATVVESGPDPMITKATPFSRFATRTCRAELSYYDQVAGETELMRRECYYMYYELSGFTGKRSYEIFVRGTMLWSDHLSNLKFAQVYDPELDSYIHSGFLRKSEVLLSDLEPLLDKGGEITVNGHSLGGAMAAIIGWKLIKRGYDVKRITTFAAPKFASKNSSKSDISCEFRCITDVKDFVPHLPVDDPLMCFKHGIYFPLGRQLRIRGSMCMCGGTQAASEEPAEGHSDGAVPPAASGEVPARVEDARGPPSCDTALYEVPAQEQRRDTWARHGFLNMPLLDVDSHRLDRYVTNLRIYIELLEGDAT